MKLHDLAIKLVERIESRDQAIVDLCGNHSDKVTGGFAGRYYLATGCVWVNGSYALMDGKLHNNSLGEVRRLISDLLEIDSQLDKIQEAVAIQAGRNEERAESLVS